MRFRKSPGRRLALAAAVLLALGITTVHLTGVLDGPQRSARLDDYRATYAFVLDSSEDCTFGIPEGCELLKIVTHGSVPADQSVDTERQYSFAIQYELLSLEGQVLRQELYHLRTQQGLTYDQTRGELIPLGVFVDSKLAPTGARVIMVPLDDLEGRVRRLRIRLADHDPALVDVSVRALLPSNPPEYKLYYLWHRLSKRQRERIAQFQLYGPEILGRKERERLLRSRWVAAAPIGLEGEGFRRRKLYLLDRKSAMSREQNIDPAGVSVGANRDGVIAVPSFANWTRLTLRPRKAGDVFAGSQVELEVHESGLETPRVESIQLEGLETVHLEQTNGGYLVIRSPLDLVVNPAVLWEDEWQELPVAEAWLPTYRTEWGEPLDYTVVGDVPFRLEFRQYFPPGETTPLPVTTTLEVLDREGQPLARHSSLLDLKPARYDQVIQGDRVGLVSEPLRLHIDLPTGARTVRVRGTAESILVSAATRPADLPRSVRIPQDQDPYARRHDGFDERPPPRNWFLIHPNNVDQRIQRQQQVILQVQSRPPERDSEAPAIAWSRVEPHGTPERCTLLMASHARREPWKTASVRFQRLEPGAQSLRIGGTPSGAAADVELIHFSEATSLTPLRLSIDGVALLDTKSSPIASSLSLGPIAPGLRKLVTQGTREIHAFINHAARPELSEPPSELEFVRQSAAWLDDSLTYDVQHETGLEQTLALRFYLPQGAANVPIRVRVHLGVRRSRATWFAQWTSSVTEFEVTAPVLNSSDSSSGWALGNPVTGMREVVGYVSIGADVTGATIPIEIERIDGPPAWVELSIGQPRDSRKGWKSYSETLRKVRK